MKKIVLLFSHQLTPKQEQDIYHSLNVEKKYTLPPALQSIWSQVPTDQELCLNSYLKEIQSFLEQHLSKGDYVLVQGDFGATYSMIQFAKQKGFKPIYSVNPRVAKEYIENGIVKKYSEFEHKFFREYV